MQKIRQKYHMLADQNLIKYRMLADQNLIIKNLLEKLRGYSQIHRKLPIPDRTLNLHF
jgi:hypothetical protein